MSINSTQIRGTSSTDSFKEALVKVNAGGSIVTDIAASHVSLAAKRGMLDLRAGTATRASINALPLDPPEKAAMLAAAGV